MPGVAGGTAAWSRWPATRTVPPRRRVRLAGAGRRGVPDRPVEAVYRKISSPDDHADPGEQEPVVPALDLADRPACQRREERPDVDPHVEDRERAVAARVALRVEPADQAGDVRLEEAVADDQQREPGEQQQFLADLGRNSARADRGFLDLVLGLLGILPSGLGSLRAASLASGSFCS